MRLIANKGSNSAELHLIDGNKLIFTLDDLVEEWEDWRILATNSCRNIGVIIIQNDSYWNIIKLTVDDKDNITKELVFVDSITDKLNESCVDTVIRYEAEDNIKLYIADSEKPLLLVNIATTRQELSIDDMYSYPQASLDAPKFAGIGDNGTLTAGLYQYAYLLYNKNGLSTEMSRTTKLIPLVNQGSSWWSTGYEKGYGNKSIVIKISIADTKMTKIRVYRIKYVENGQIPTIELIKDQNITANDMYVTDSG